MTEMTSMQKVKVRGQRSRSQRSTPDLAVSGPYLQFEFTYDDEMLHRAWCCLEEVSYCFSRSYVKFQGHMARKFVLVEDKRLIISFHMTVIMDADVPATQGCHHNNSRGFGLIFAVNNRRANSK